MLAMAAIWAAFISLRVLDCAATTIQGQRLFESSVRLKKYCYGRLVLRHSPPPIVDLLQYVSTEGERPGQMHVQSTNHMKNMLCKSHPGHILANTRLHQLCWGDWEMGTAISCTKRSQAAGLIQRVGRSF